MLLGYTTTAPKKFGATPFFLSAKAEQAETFAEEIAALIAKPAKAFGETGKGRVFSSATVH